MDDIDGRDNLLVALNLRDFKPRQVATA